VGLVLAQKLGVELDVAGLVDTVNVTEASGNGEVRGDGRQGVVDVEDVLGLGVERVVVNILVVDTVLLTTSDANLHLEPLLHRGSTLEVLGGGLNVPVDGLLGEIDHVGAEQGLAVGLKVGLIGIEHAIEPRQKLLGAVVGVQDDGDTVGGSDRADVVGSRNGTSNRSSLVSVAHTLAGEVSGTTLGHLDDDGGLGITSSLQRSNDGGGRSDVDGRHSELVLASVLKQTQDIVADNDTGLAAENIGNTHVCGCR
jgi:hypothetical protein